MIPAHVQSAARELGALIAADCALRDIQARVVVDAPYDLATLLARVERHGAGWTIPVSGAHSDRTVHGPVGNVRFRAWRDVDHVEGALPFDVPGELAAARRGLDRLRARGASREALDLLDVEVRGQVLYRARHGAFPSDQVAFAAHAFAHGLPCAVERGGF